MSEDKRNDEQQLFEDSNSKDQDHIQETGNKTSYYYSYGPFKSIPSAQNSEEGSTQMKEATEVEMTPPEPVKPLNSMSFYSASSSQFQPHEGGMNSPGSGNGGVPGGTMPNWQFNPTPVRTKTSYKALFASFLAGMVVIGSLMFVSDRYNLFTGSNSATPSSSYGSSDAITTSANVSAPNIERPGNITSIVKQTSPAVVKIETFVKSSRSNQSSYLDDPFFRQFFGDNYGQGNQRNDSKNDTLVPNGLGSGFVFDKNGYILTNHHVIANADSIQVTLEGYKQPFKAKLLGSSFDLDLAVLKIEGDNFPTLKIGSSDAMQSGDWVVAIGNPNGFDHTVTAGVVSAKERSISIPDQEAQKTRNYKHLLQTDASINPGNSGGPLLNMNGEVIGMNVAVSAQSQGIGFAIPTKTILEVVDQLKANKEIPKEPDPFIGATLATLTDEMAQQLKIDKVEGSIVTQVLYKTPAYEADLRAYDIITGIDGTKYSTNEQLIEQIKKHKVGDSVTLNVLRNGKQLDLKVTIGDKNKYQVSE